MANYQSVYIRNRGLPAVGLTPTFQTLVDIQTGDPVVSQPTIEEIGNGWYRIISEIDYPDHHLGVIDAGDSINDNGERFIPVNFRFSDFDLDNKEVYVVPVFDDPSNSVQFITYLLVNGRIQQDHMVSATIAVKDANHNLIFTMTTATFTNGIAVTVQNNPGFVANRSYYMEATIVTENETLRSMDTFITLQ